MAEIADRMKKRFGAKPVLVLGVSLISLLLLSAVILSVVLSGQSPGNTYDPPVVKGSGAAPSAEGDGKTPTVEVLPETERAVPEKDPFDYSGEASGMNSFRLMGIVSNSAGTSAAIITFGGNSYIVQEGDPIGETAWKAAVINETDVVITDGSGEKTLELDHGSDK